MILYKYYPPESFNLICVENGANLRISQPKLLNDPFDLNMSYDKKIHKRDISPYDYFNKKFGVLSLTENFNSRIMWSNYSKDHSGFMIEIETDGLDIFEMINEVEMGFKDPNYILRNVQYSKERPKYPEKLDLENDILNFAFIKDDLWEYEKEYRLVFFLWAFRQLGDDPRGYPIHYSTLKPSHISKIILGARSSETLEQQAKFWIKKHAPNVELEKAEICSKEYKLIYKPIKN